MPDPYRPIRNLGYLFTALGGCGVLVLFARLTDGGSPDFFRVFIVSVSFLHLFLGVGLLLRKKRTWGLFKGYLRLLYLGFPLGTYLSRATLRYIDENKIERLLQ